MLALTAGSVVGVAKTKLRVTKRRVGPAEVRAELDAWEAKYGVKSENLIEAFRDPKTGELAETEDFFAWVQAYDAWQHINHS